MGIPKEGNPQETQLGGEVSRGSDSAKCLPKRIERYGKARNRAVLMVEHLRSGTKSVPEFEATKLYQAINSCGNYLVFHNYYTVDKTRLVGASFCKKHQVCPLCAIRRSSKMLKSYLDRFLAIRNLEIANTRILEVGKLEIIKRPAMRASLCTLTVKNGDDLSERFEHLLKSVKTLLKWRRSAISGQRYTTEFSKVEGLVGTYEVTNKGNGWHPHTHMIILHRDDIDQDNLADEWQKITGDSFVVDVRPLQHPNDPAQDFVEVFKYAVKFSDLSLEDNLHAYWVLKGRRLVYSAGTFRGVDVPEELTDEVLDDLPYIELFYKYFNSRGYSLTKSKIVLKAEA